MSSQKRKGSGFESRIVREAQATGLNARKQPGSGVFKDFPNDAVIESILIEAKAGYTRLNVRGEKHFSLDVDWINKVLSHAKESGFDGWLLAMRPDGIRRWWLLGDGQFILDLILENKELRRKLSAR